jgi:hypothetical protein
VAMPSDFSRIMYFITLYLLCIESLTILAQDLGKV